MSKQLVSIVFFLLSAAAFGAQAPPAADVAFTGVNVIPMTGDSVLTDMTVLVSDGRIRALGTQASVVKPKGVRTIDARGKYLIPGLAEMHAHVPGAQSTQSYREDVLLLYAANGVTLARGMLGEPMHLQLRSDLANHRLLGPRLITSGPSVNGNSAKTVEDAARMVREQKAAGYDFVKLHPGLKRDVFLAMAAAAREAGIDFAGHVSADVGLDLALEQGQKTVDHLDGYLVRLLPAAARAGQSPDDLSAASRSDPALIGEVVRMTRAANAWIVPTQTLYDNLIAPISIEELAARPETRYLPLRLREQYRASKERMLQTPGYANEVARKVIDVRRALIKALSDGGAGLLLGSDAPQIYNVPGFSVHRELQSMVAAGLTPYQALRMGTSAPAAFFGAEGDYGTIVAGAEADLILLNANPLENIENTEKIEGVMVRGRWLERAFLDRELEAVAKRAREQ